MNLESCPPLENRALVCSAIARFQAVPLKRPDGFCNSFAIRRPSGTHKPQHLADSKEWDIAETEARVPYDCGEQDLGVGIRSGQKRSPRNWHVGSCCCCCRRNHCCVNSDAGSTPVVVGADARDTSLGTRNGREYVMNDVPSRYFLALCSSKIGCAYLNRGGVGQRWPDIHHASGFCAFECRMEGSM